LINALVWLTILGLFGACLYGSIVLLLTGKKLKEEAEF